jgi:hypothetical protein
MVLSAVAQAQAPELVPLEMHLFHNQQHCGLGCAAAATAAPVHSSVHPLGLWCGAWLAGSREAAQQL